jgi:hypothetical protein
MIMRRDPQPVPGIAVAAPAGTRIMTKSFFRRFILGMTFLALTAAQLSFVPRATASEFKQIWGMTTIGDTCTGACGGTNICCRIVVIVV